MRLQDAAIIALVFGSLLGGRATAQPPEGASLPQGAYGPAAPAYPSSQTLPPSYQMGPGFGPPNPGAMPRQPHYDGYPAGEPYCAERPVLFWARGEYLLWWIKDQALPPLVTTSTSQQAVGRLGFPDTKVLYGGLVDGELRQGARFTMGGELGTLSFCGCCCLAGVEANFFWLEHHDNPYKEFSAGDPVLARPFFDVNLGTNRVEQVANVRLTDAAGNLLVRAVAGRVTVNNPSEMYGGEFNTVYALSNVATVRSHFLLGGRFLHLREDLNVREDLVQLADAAAGIPQTTFLVQDRFRTNNDFVGGQFGLRSLMFAGRWSLELQGKLALGITRQTVRINGATYSAADGGEVTVGTGGLLALPTNIGVYHRDQFTVVPEGTVNLGCHLSRQLRVFCGYNFLYWSSVFRPGPQIDLGINPNFLPPQTFPIAGPIRPAFLGAASDLWVQGLNLGMEFTY